MDRQAGHPSLKTENIFHSVLKQAKQRPSQELWGLCVSGGLDSVVLLHLMREVAKSQSRSLVVFHVHHGENDSQEQVQFRNQSAHWVDQLCREGGLKLYSNWSATKGISSRFRPTPTSGSEADFRNYRWRCLQRLCEDHQIAPTFLTAHHRDDVLETRLIQMIRGVGPEGLASFQAASRGVWRPLFDFQRAELHHLALRRQWKWMEDPSNQNPQPLRNWLRQVWLPELEKKRPGSLQSLHRSLDLVIQHLQNDPTVELSQWFTARGIPRGEFGTLSRKHQQQLISQLLRSKGVKNYTKGQMEEILKRLENVSQQIQFTLCGLRWKTDKFYIQASRD